MLYPSVNDLLQKVDSSYTLVVASAKRARQLIEGREPLVRIDSRKPVSIATKEIFEGKVTYTRLIEENK